MQNLKSDWRNGRRRGLKILWDLAAREGSNPSSDTKFMKITTNQKTPLSGMAINCRLTVELSPEEADRVFWKRLTDLTENMFMRDGFLWKCGEDQMGHDWEEKIGPIEDEQYKMAVQAIRLKMAIVEAAI